MKKVIVSFAILVLGLLVFSLVWNDRNLEGYAVSSGGGGSGGGSGSSGKSKVGNACTQAPFSNDPNAKVCGKGCCFGGFSCYKDEVCCNDLTEVGNSIPGVISFCEKKCDITKKQKQCGEVCCDISAGEVCVEQGLLGKNHGVCLKAEQAKRGCDISAGETQCPPKGKVKKDPIFECCAANQDCKLKKMGLSITPDFAKKDIWGCSVNPNKAGGCGKNTFCKGEGKDFKEYGICCKPYPEETCANHPNGQPYCYTQKQSSGEKKISLINRFRSFLGLS